jgi:hypothetical protein
MDEPMIIALAICRGRTLDQPDLAEHLTAQSAWHAWTPLEDLLELPREAEEVIDAASASLGHFSPTAGRQRRHAWECARAAARGLARPLPQPPLPAGVRQPRKARRGARHALAGLWRRRPRPARRSRC